MKGWVDMDDWLHTEMFFLSAAHVAVYFGLVLVFKQKSCQNHMDARDFSRVLVFVADVYTGAA